MVKRSLQWWMIAWAVVLTLWPVYAFPAEISGVYELREKGEVRKLEITEHRGMGSLQFALYVQSGNFSGSMFGLATKGTRRPIREKTAN